MKWRIFIQTFKHFQEFPFVQTYKHFNLQTVSTGSTKIATNVYHIFTQIKPSSPPTNFLLVSLPNARKWPPPTRLTLPAVLWLFQWKKKRKIESPSPSKRYSLLSTRAKRSSESLDIALDSRNSIGATSGRRWKKLRRKRWDESEKAEKRWHSKGRVSCSQERRDDEQK